MNSPFWRNCKVCRGWYKILGLKILRNCDCSFEELRERIKDKMTKEVFPKQTNKDKQQDNKLTEQQRLLEEKLKKKGKGIKK